MGARREDSMRRNTLCSLVAGLVAAGAGACGGSDGIGTSAGSGNGALQVDGTFEYDDGGAQIRIRVRTAAGADVSTAEVIVGSDDGEIRLAYAGNGDYDGFFDGWVSSGYTIDVRNGEDFVTGSIAAPDPAFVTSPDPAQGFDPQADSDGIIQIRWSGGRAQSVRVRTDGFEWGPAGDEGGLGIPAVTFVHPSQEITISRENSTPLAGGAPGSSLTAGVEVTTDLIVANPFPG
jgi:hypothetical protein